MMKKKKNEKEKVINGFNTMDMIWKGFYIFIFIYLFFTILYLYLLPSWYKFVLIPCKFNSVRVNRYEVSYKEWKWDRYTLKTFFIRTTPQCDFQFKWILCYESKEIEYFMYKTFWTAVSNLNIIGRKFDANKVKRKLKQKF